jgi:hypothetical protein
VVSILSQKLEVKLFTGGWFWWFCRKHNTEKIAIGRQKITSILTPSFVEFELKIYSVRIELNKLFVLFRINKLFCAIGLINYCGIISNQDNCKTKLLLIIYFIRIDQIIILSESKKLIIFMSNYLSDVN